MAAHAQRGVGGAAGGDDHGGGGAVEEFEGRPCTFVVRLCVCMCIFILIVYVSTVWFIEMGGGCV